MGKDDLLQFIRVELAATDAIDEDTALFSTGLIDSFALVSIVAFVEKQCSLRVSEEDMTLAHWDTVSKIMRFVQTRASTSHP